MKTEIKALLASVVVVALCVCVISGVTYSWFSDSEQSEIGLTTGTMSVSTSEYTLTYEGSVIDSGDSLPAKISISNVAANRVCVVEYDATFESTLDAAYRVTASMSGLEPSQTEYVSITVDATDSSSKPVDIEEWQEMPPSESPITLHVTVTIETDIGFGTGLDASVPYEFTVDVDNEMCQSDAIGLQVNEDGKIEIDSVTDLRTLARTVNSGEYDGSDIILTSDIDLGGMNWTPIGTKTDAAPGTAIVNSVTGTFDGQDHTISNFIVNAEENSPAGLFGIVQGAVKNLKVEDVTVNSLISSAYVNGAGAVVGVLWNYDNDSAAATVENVTVSDVRVNGSHFIGGVVGYNYGGTVTDCQISDAVLVCTPNESSSGYDNGDKVGGVVGYLGGGTVSGNSAKDVSLTAYRDVGGILGTAATPSSIAATVSGNTATGISITVDQITHNYGDKAINASGTIGRMEGSATQSDNTSSDVTIKVLSDSSDTIVSAIELGAQVQLNNDLNLTDRITVPAGASSTIDLNGHDITTESHGFYVAGDLVINGEGTVSCGNHNGEITLTGEYVTIFATGDGTITINGGTYVSYDYAEVVYASGNGKVIINGGTFMSHSDDTDAGRLLNVHNSSLNASIEVHGGTFYNYDPSTGDDAREGTDTFVADRCTVSSSTMGQDTIYTVVPATAP